jgi:uncharacterized protein YcbX
VVSPSGTGSDASAAEQPLLSSQSTVGTIDTLWRYPVKSMLGERRDELDVTTSGALGDRAWALREAATGRIASAKRFPMLLEFEAVYEIEPKPRQPGRVRITMPDGRTLHPDDPSASATISAMLGVAVILENAPRASERTGIDRDSVFGGVPVAEMNPEWTPETMPDYFQLKHGSFLEIGSIYLLASGSVDRLGALHGGTGAIDQRRFRPNVFIDSGPGGDAFVEDDWVGRTIRLGGEVVCGDLAPTLWCVTSTLAQQDLPRDPSVLRTIAYHHGGCLGVYGSVAAPGVIRRGDPVRVLESPRRPD